MDTSHLAIVVRGVVGSVSVRCGQCKWRAPKRLAHKFAPQLSEGRVSHRILRVPLVGGSFCSSFFESPGQPWGFHVLRLALPSACSATHNAVCDILHCLTSHRDGLGATMMGPERPEKSTQWGMQEQAGGKKKPAGLRYARTSAERQLVRNCSRSSANSRQLAINRRRCSANLRRLSVNRRPLTATCHRYPEAAQWDCAPERWRLQEGGGGIVRPYVAQFFR